MPGDRLAGLVHEGLIGVAEGVVLAVLPEIVLRDAPLGLEILAQGLHTLALLLLLNVDEELQNEITAVAQLTLKLVDRAHALFVFVLRDLAAQELAHHVLHPAGIVEHDLAVFRNGPGIGREEGIAALRLRRDDR